MSENNALTRGKGYAGMMLGPSPRHAGSGPPPDQRSYIGVEARLW